MQVNPTQKSWTTLDRPGHLIMRLAKLTTRIADQRFKALGLATAAMPVLSLLRDGSRQTQATLATCARVEQPSMAQLLNRMQRDGLIERGPDPDDGRSSLVWLTEKALNLLPAVDALISEGNTRAVQGMSEAEVAALLRLLKQMIANLETYDSEPRP